MNTLDDRPRDRARQVPLARGELSAARHHLSMPKVRRLKVRLAGLGLRFAPDCSARLRRQSLAADAGASPRPLHCVLQPSLGFAIRGALEKPALVRRRRRSRAAPRRRAGASPSAETTPRAASGRQRARRTGGDGARATSAPGAPAIADEPSASRRTRRADLRGLGASHRSAGARTTDSGARADRCGAGGRRPARRAATTAASRDPALEKRRQPRRRGDIKERMARARPRAACG